MRLITAFLLTLISAVSAAIEGPLSYSGYKVVRVRADPRRSSLVREKLASLAVEPWNPDSVNGNIDIAIPPEESASFLSLGLDHRVLHSDLGRSIAAESALSHSWSRLRAKRQADDLSWYDNYHSYEDHIQYFKDLQLLFPNNSEAISSGISFEGRDLYGLHLWGAGGPGKPAVLYHGTVHAREWIATMTVEYLTLQLILGYNTGDEDVQSFLDSYDFYILPVVNPDGFVYSQTQDRLWRKSRQPPPTNATDCLGVDLNRNWAFAWDPSTGGSSSNPCSQTYAGPGPSSTPENQGLSALVDSLRDGAGIKLYIDFHSYGQKFLSPFGYNETVYPPELGKWERAGALVSDAIREYEPRTGGEGRRTTFVFGPGGAVEYRSVGNGRDHVYAVGGADFSWTFELPDTGDFGFVLPPELIRPTVEEQWAGQLVLLGLLDEVFFDGEGQA